MLVKEVSVKDYVSISKLPASDYVINPYVGCNHACKYCYASFMKRFTNHKEEWGEFVDIKLCDKKINKEKLKHKKVFLSSVTDCYNPLEKKYKITKVILEQLKDIDCFLTITTKSSLILRDIELLKQMKNLEVAISINTLDENFKNDMDRASSITERINTLKILHDNGIKTILFMSPIFPGITKPKEIILKTKDYVDLYWFENLNLRSGYKITILNYIKEKYPQYFPIYDKIYNQKDMTYWEELGKFLNDFCKENKINAINYFYHEKIRKN